jgi:Uma2 family endonuclease
MSVAVPFVAVDETVYPESDGAPIAENPVQYRWIVMLHGNLSSLFRDDPNVVVFADHFVYPVQFRPDIRVAPDVYVVFGRPKGDRPSYRVWTEGGIFPQVVFEVLSPCNRPTEMARKLEFYDRYGVEEYYIYDPDSNELIVYIRNANTNRLSLESDSRDFVSPRLNIRFDFRDEVMTVYGPEGSKFLTFDELHDAYAAVLAQQSTMEKHLIDMQRQKNLAQKQQAEAERERAEAVAKAERLAAQLKALGVTLPDGEA